jgi:hypothetical protein
MLTARSILLVAVVSAFLANANPSQAAEQMNTVYVGTRPLFSVSAGVGNQTAAQRTTVIQKNLDQAILGLSSGEPQCSVLDNDGMPVVTLNGHYIVGIDPSLASQANLSQRQLADTWAKQLQSALTNETASNAPSYDVSSRTLSSVIGPVTTIDSRASMRFVRMPEGLVLPMVLETDINTSALRAGDEIAAHTTADITLPTGEVLAHGTRIFGDLIATTPMNMFGPAPLKLSFSRMQLVNGTQFPVSASVILNGKRIDNFIINPESNRTYTMGRDVMLELRAPAQVAVTGTML